jgi:hypothetical protein
MHVTYAGLDPMQDGNGFMVDKGWLNLVQLVRLGLLQVEYQYPSGF